MRQLRFAPFAAIVMLAACSQPAPPQATRPNKPVYDVVASIRAAGERETSAIDVAALRDPGVQHLQDGAHADDLAGRYSDAAAKLDNALKLAPDSPDILQDRAEIAVRLNDGATAERLAHRSCGSGEAGSGQVPRRRPEPLLAVLCGSEPCSPRTCGSEPCSCCSFGALPFPVAGSKSS